MLLTCIFFSEIRSDKWTADQSEKSEWSEYDAENRQNDDCDDKPDIASTDSSLGAAEFFGPSRRNDIIQHGKKDDNQRPDDEKCPSKRMRSGQLQEDERDIRKQWSRQDRKQWADDRCNTQ